MIKYKKKILQNGLTVIAHRDVATPMAAVNLLYKVGSRNEDEDHTGFAHLFEHLMFGGSFNIPDFDAPIQMAGGENNAFTNNDYTNYYIALPKENIETALWVESDRMKALNFDQHSLDVQRKVVIEEFGQRYLNQPYGDLWLLLRPLCYKVHPYKWATIGKEISHIENATLQQVSSFWHKYYQPNNAILTIGADLEEDAMLELAQKWFGDIESRSVVNDVILQEPIQNEPRELIVQRDVSTTVIYLAFPMGKRNSRQSVICDVISDILSNGTSSRLYQRLVKENRLFSSVNAYVTGEIDEGLFVVTAHLLPQTTNESALDALWGELNDLKSVEVSDYELEKVKNKFEATNIFSEINVLNKAINLAFFEYLGDANLINEEVESYNSVTKEEIVKTAKELLTKNRSNTLLYCKRDDK